MEPEQAARKLIFQDGGTVVPNLVIGADGAGDRHW